MAKWTAAVIGCGGRGRAHAEGYAASPEVQTVAAADPAAENAQRLADAFDVREVYADYRELLAKHHPQLVSVCTWPDSHLEIVEAAAAAGARAIHAEKPMAPTWGAARRMHQVCVDRGVQLTLCHQRRFAPHFVKARQLLLEGAIGELVRVEGYCSNLFDWGTHWFDMMEFFNQENDAAWVMGQIDASEPRKVFGVPVETAGLSYVKFANGVTGMLVTGKDPVDGRANRLVGGEGMILLGTKGRMEVGVQHGPPLRIHREGHAPEVPDLKGVVPAGGDTALSVADMIRCLESGEEPELSSYKALRSTELIFATYESSRRRARVTLPLLIDDSPLLDMLEQGVIGGGTTIGS